MEKNDFIGYEYKEVPVRRGMVPVYTDGYENFGWKLEGTEECHGKLAADKVKMKFKRDRKIINKAELIRLQRKFDACVAEIQSLEASKRGKAAVVSYAVGAAGTAFMAGSVFAVTAGNVVSCVLLAVPGFAGWMLPYFLFKYLERKRTGAVAPLIDKKYDELYTVCEKAHSLLTA